MKIDIFNTSKKYDIIYTDPPWKQGKGGKKKVRPNSSGGKLDYETLEIDEIKKIHSKILQDETKEIHNVFMWAIDKYLVDTEKMMQELGYKLHARIIWDKTNGVSPAFTVRFSHEYLLWFYKPGTMLKPCKEMRGRYTTVLREPSTKHSKKPVCAYEMLESMFPNTSKLEMFARNTREDWDCWGNEVDGTDLTEVTNGQETNTLEI